MAVIINDLDVTNLELNYFKTNDNKKRVYINKGKHTRGGVKLQLCALEPNSMVRAPFGISEPMQGVPENGRLSMELAINSQVTSDKFKELDEKCIKYLHKESVKCFGKQLDINTIRDRFISPLRPATDEGRSDLLRLKISDKCEVFCMYKYDNDNKEMKLREGSQNKIRRGSVMTPMVELSPMWFISGDKQIGYSLHAYSVILDEVNMPEAQNHKMGADAFIVANGVKLVVTDEKETSVAECEKEPSVAECEKGESQDSTPLSNKRNGKEANLDINESPSKKKKTSLESEEMAINNALEDNKNSSGTDAESDPQSYL